MGPDVLPKWERRLYWIGGISGMFYCIYSFYRECQDNISFISTQPGIKLLGGIKDSPDNEWNTISEFLPYLAPLLVGHVFTSHFLFTLQLNIQLQKSLRLLYDVLAIVFMFGYKPVLLCIVKSLIMFMLTRQRHIFVVWITAICFTTSLNMDWSLFKLLKILDCPFSEIVSFFIYISYVHIRLISASITIIKQRNAIDKNLSSEESISHNKYLGPNNSKGTQSNANKDADLKEDKSSMYPISETPIIDFMIYIFHLPTFVCGPIITFDEFFPQFTAFYQCSRHSYDIKDIGKRLLRIIFSYGFVEVQSHFLFLNGVPLDSEFVRRLPASAVIGLALCQGQYFHMKYLHFFGFGSVFSILDGLTPPQQPACISRLYSFSDIWKYFDVGLYNFIKKYIYVYWGGSKAGFLHQIIGIVFSFSFICNWHGAYFHIIIWCFGNLVIVILEMCGARFEFSQYGSMLKSILGPAGFLRFKGLAAVPLYLASTIQIMFFFFSCRNWLCYSRCDNFQSFMDNFYIPICWLILCNAKWDANSQMVP